MSYAHQYDIYWLIILRSMVQVEALCFSSLIILCLRVQVETDETELNQS